ncbi:MAG: hypothetical protein ABSB32_14440 [Thermodesulfobacteriota bacterium]|jgi:hypothetical protein
MSRKRGPDYLLIWVDARKKFHLSHAQIQMARELNLNPKRLGKLANEDQEPWKMPLPQFIEHLYRKRFKRDFPEVVMSLEEWVKIDRRKKLARREKKRAENKETGDDLMTGNPEGNR